MEDKRVNPDKGRWRNHPKPVLIKCRVCSTEFTVMWSRRERAKYCSFKCKQTGAGRVGGTVRGEQIKALSQGKAYKKTKGKHTHRVIAESMLGRALLPNEVVHHKDGNILNNDPANLEVLSSQAEHMKHHRKTMLAARKEKHGY